MARSWQNELNVPLDVAASAGFGHSCVAFQLPAWSTLAMECNQEQSRNRDEAIFLTMLASSWATIYSLYIRLSSQNKTKQKESSAEKDGFIWPPGRQKPAQEVHWIFHLWYFISTRIPARLAHAQSCIIQTQTYWWNEHTWWYPLVCELFVTWAHGQISTKVNWATGEKKRELCLRDSEWCCSDLPKHSHCPAHSVRTK